MSTFVGASATDTISNMIGTGTAANPTGKHWGQSAAQATQGERAATVNGLQYRINAGIDSPRVVGSPVMAYSPRSQTSETHLDKKLHGIINADGSVVSLKDIHSTQNINHVL